MNCRIRVIRLVPHPAERTISGKAHIPKNVRFNGEEFLLASLNFFHGVLPFFGGLNAQSVDMK